MTQNKPINRAPVHLRCPMGDCPSVREDGDDLIIVGKDITKSEAVNFGLRMGAAEAAIRIPKSYFEGLACDHLGNVLSILADLRLGDRCQALNDAQAFYNELRPDQKIEPTEGYAHALILIESPLGPSAEALGLIVHPDLEAKAREIACNETGCWIKMEADAREFPDAEPAHDQDCDHLTVRISTALRDAYENGKMVSSNADRVAGDVRSPDANTSFNPDWELTIVEKIAVALTISLSKHVPNWPGATDEQLAAVAGDIAQSQGAAIRARGDAK